MRNSEKNKERDDEEPVTMSDQQMVFCSEQASPPKRSARKTNQKSTTSSIKLRQCTPAPPTKGDSRKRFVVSPLPEDKQLRKRIDFGDEEASERESPKCEAAMTSATPMKGRKKKPDGLGDKIGEEEEELVSEVMQHEFPSDEEGPPELGLSVVVEPEKVGHKATVEIPLCQEEKESTAAVRELVNNPNMEIETNPLLERQLVVFQSEGSRDLYHNESPIRTKADEILQLASDTSAEKFDCAAAQPLLNIFPPETFRHEGLIVGAQGYTKEVPNASYLEEFPPLVQQGRTKLLRDAFEKGPSTTASGKPAAWAVKRFENRGSKFETGEASSKPSVETGSGIPNKSGYTAASDASAIPKKANNPKSMADIVREQPDPHGPQVFVPEKIENIGFAGMNNGIPSIYFSGKEIQKLAENMGQAIVGKFSHSIPTMQQIQKGFG